MKEIGVICDYCGGSSRVTIISEKPYSIVQCRDCGLAFLSPRPNKAEIAKLYNTDYFHNTDISTGYSDYSGIEQDLVKEADRRLDYIHKYCIGGTLLDAGCGFGTFLLRAKEKGYHVTGCDISHEAAREMKKKRIRVVTAAIDSDKFPKGPFDIITGWDVIEHVLSPAQSFNALSLSQKRGGFLFLTTPNLESIDAKIMGTGWYGFKRIPEHLYYFTPSTIGRYLKKSGYEVIDIRPWGFQRNLAYCVEQIARYNKGVHRILRPVSRAFGFNKISFYFPFIDMIIAAKKL